MRTYAILQDARLQGCELIEQQLRPARLTRLLNPAFFLPSRDDAVDGAVGKLAAFQLA